jgi:hypothetical protein
MSGPTGYCERCTTVLVGRYCYACGHYHALLAQEPQNPKPTSATNPTPRVIDLIEDLIDNVWSFTRQMPATAWALVARPSALLAGLHGGDRATYLSPLKLYITATTLFFVFLSASHTSLAQFEIKREPRQQLTIAQNGEEIILTGVRVEEKFLYPRQTAASDTNVVRAFDAAIPNITDPIFKGFLSFYRGVAADPSQFNTQIATWIPRLLWLLMPVYGLLLWPLFGGKSLYRHLIFALWVHTIFFMTLILGALWNRTGLVNPWFNGVTFALGLSQVYVTIGAKSHFDVNWLAASFKTGFLTLLYVGLIWLPIIAGFFLWQITPNDVRADLFH